MTRTKSIFIIGHDAPNLERLRRLPHAAECEFYSALDRDEIRGVSTFDVEALIRRAVRRIEAHSRPPDGVVAYLDFPASTMLPIVAGHFGLPGATLESVLKCEHKYWSRMEQRKFVPEHVPQFEPFDPCTAELQPDTPLTAPFWIKPIKSYRSHMCFLVNDQRQFREYSAQQCHGLEYVVNPFRALLSAYHMPEEIAGMVETSLAESLIGGAQSTVEGYVHDGEVVVYGIIDSVREANSSSFARYQYPSALPLTVQHQMADISRRLVTGINLDNTCFNIEFFWDQAADRIWLLEINPRLSQSHGDMFELVHGISHHAHMVDLAMGRRPPPLPQDGPFKVAANCHMRVFQEGRVKRVPTDGELADIAGAVPGVRIRIRVTPGQLLSELQDEDSYSYEVANIFVGAGDEDELLEKYDRVRDMLRLDIEPLEAGVELRGGAGSGMGRPGV